MAEEKFPLPGMVSRQWLASWTQDYQCSLSAGVVAVHCSLYEIVSAAAF